MFSSGLIIWLSNSSFCGYLRIETEENYVLSKCHNKEENHLPDDHLSKQCWQQLALTHSFFSRIFFGKFFRVIWRPWCESGVLLVNFDHIQQVDRLFYFSNFEHLIACWKNKYKIFLKLFVNTSEGIEMWHWLEMG